jgi:hypothetical protein
MADESGMDEWRQSSLEALGYGIDDPLERLADMPYKTGAWHFDNCLMAAERVNTTELDARSYHFLHISLLLCDPLMWHGR